MPLVFALAVAAIPATLLVAWFVHGVLECLSVSHGQRFCRRRGLQANRVRWRPAFDTSGVKTEFTLIQLDCFDPRKQRRLVTLLVWPFGVWQQVSEGAYPEPDDGEWPPEPARPNAVADAGRR